MLFIGVRGSGESPQGAAASNPSAYTTDSQWTVGSEFTGMGPFVQGMLDGRGPGGNPAARDSFIQTLEEEGIPRSKVEVRALVYEAAPTSLLLQSVRSWIPLKINGSMIAEYLASVESGSAALTSLLRSKHTACPEQKIVLAGYSQGALVIHHALNRLSDANAAVVDSIVATNLLADPAQAVFSSHVKLGSSEASVGGLTQSWTGADRRDIQQDIPVRSFCDDLDAVCAPEAASWVKVDGDELYGFEVHTRYDTLDMRALGRLAAWDTADAVKSGENGDAG